MCKERGTEIRLILIFIAVLAALQLFHRKEPGKQPIKPAVTADVMDNVQSEAEQGNSMAGTVHLKDVLAALTDEPLSGDALLEEVLVTGLVVQTGKETLVYIGELDMLAETDLGQFLEEYPSEAAYAIAVTFDKEPPRWEVGQGVSFSAAINKLALKESKVMKVHYILEETSYQH